MCLQNNEALVLTAPAWGKASSGDTYVLVPLRGIRAGQPVSVFGVYATTPEVGHTFLYATLRCRRLPVVFDLDETLIKAKAENSLDRKPQEEYPGRRAEAEQIADAAERQRALESLQVEYKLYAEDLAMLRTYADRNEVLTPDGLLLHARPEPGGFFDLSSRTVTPVHRPVIRGPLQDGNPLRVFTRINPGNVDTSMVLYLRPQWPAVFEKFAGVGSRPNGPHQPLVEAYVCTAGQGSYAHEAWRVLDHGAALIPSDKCRLLSRSFAMLHHVNESAELN